jgi:hypothetical protein
MPTQEMDAKTTSHNVVSNFAHFRDDTLKLGMKQGQEDQTRAERRPDFLVNSIVFQSISVTPKKSQHRTAKKNSAHSINNRQKPLATCERRMPPWFAD